MPTFFWVLIFIIITAGVFHGIACERLAIMKRIFAPLDEIAKEIEQGTKKTRTKKDTNSDYAYLKTTARHIKKGVNLINKIIK